MDLVPINSCVLVELTDELQFVEMPDKQYSTNTSGIVRSVALHEPDFIDLVGKRVYFEGFKDVEVPGDIKYAFIKIEDLRGFQNVET